MPSIEMVMDLRGKLTESQAQCFALAARVRELEAALHEIAGTHGRECASPRYVAANALAGRPMYDSDGVLDGSALRGL